MNLSPLPKLAFLDNNGRPLVGGKLFTYEAGTSNKIATYKSEDGLSQNTNPVILDFRGEADVWLDPVLTYKFVLAPANDTDPPTNPIWSVDNITVLGLTQQIIGQILWPISAAEIAAGLAIADYGWPWGDVRRYGAVGNDVADDVFAVQQAIEQCEFGGAPVLVPKQFTCFCSDNLVINSPKVILMGEGKYVSRLRFPATKGVRVTASEFTAAWIGVEGPDADDFDGFGTGPLTCVGTVGAYLNKIQLIDVDVINSRADGILLEFVEQFAIDRPSVKDCAAIGISLASCQDGVVTAPSVQDINLLAGLVNAYGITCSQSGVTELAHPVCKRIEISAPDIYNIPSWSGIDTHAGQDILVIGGSIRKTLYGIHLGAGSTVGETRAPVRCKALGVNMDSEGTFGGVGIVLHGRSDVPGAPIAYAEDLSAIGCTIKGYGSDDNNGAAITMQSSRGTCVLGNTIHNAQRSCVTLIGDNQGFLIQNNIGIDPHSASAVTPAFLRIPGDYNKGFVAGNALIRGTLVATAVAVAYINRSPGTYTNSDIEWDYSYSQNTGPLYYTNPDLSIGEYSQMRRSTDRVASYTGTLTGVDSVVTGTIEVRRSGNVLSMIIPVIEGTSNTTAATITGMPSAYWPATAQSTYCKTKNSGTIAGASATIGTNGVLTLHRNADPASTFDASGIKGAAATVFTYSLT